MYTLQYKAKISRRQAREKICAHAMYGNHGNSFRPSSIREVQQYFLRRGFNTDDLTEQCRSPQSCVPVFENLVRSTWRTNGSGTVSLVDRDGEVIHKVKGPGEFLWSNYEAHFEAACAARDRAVAEDSYSAFQECLSQGFASIDAFINTQGRTWNEQHPGDKLSDSRASKVSLEEKLDKWVPKISGGAELSKTDRVWNDFKTLKKLRDEDAIHPKLPGYGISYGDLAKRINAFRFGIALFLGKIHLLIGRPVPAVIINAVYMPDVDVVDVADNENSK